MMGLGIRSAPGPLTLPRSAAGVATVAAGATGEFQDFKIPAGLERSQVTVRFFSDQPGVGRLYRRTPGATIDPDGGTVGFRLAMPEVTLTAASTEDELARLDVSATANDHFRFRWSTDAGAAAPATVTAEVMWKRGG